MADAKPEVAITELTPGRYKAQRGRYIITFTVDPRFNITLMENTTSQIIKDYHFEHSKPELLLDLASLMKHVAVYVMTLKKKAHEATQ